MLEDRTRSFDDEKIRIEEFNRNLNNIQNEANELLKPLNSKQKLLLAIQENQNRKYR